MYSIYRSTEYIGSSRLKGSTRSDLVDLIDPVNPIDLADPADPIQPIQGCH